MGANARYIAPLCASHSRPSVLGLPSPRDDVPKSDRLLSSRRIRPLLPEAQSLRLRVGITSGRELKGMQTGFVGLGAMGAHMARNLHRAGLLTGVWNRTSGKATALAQELRCHAFASLAELAGNCEAVVICVSADDDLRAVIAGLDSGLSPNMVVIDCSTVGAGTAREMYDKLAAIGVGFLDCPVSGGVEGARAASLAELIRSEPCRAWSVRERCSHPARI